MNFFRQKKVTLLLPFIIVLALVFAGIIKQANSKADYTNENLEEDISLYENAENVDSSTLKEMTRLIINKKLGIKTNTGVERIEAISVADFEGTEDPDDKVINVVLNADVEAGYGITEEEIIDESFTALEQNEFQDYPRELIISYDLTRQKMLAASKTLFMYTFRQKEVALIQVTWQLPLDEDNQRFAKLLDIEIDKPTAESIKWGLYHSDHLKLISKNYSIHPALLAYYQY